MNSIRYYSRRLASTQRGEALSRSYMNDDRGRPATFYREKLDAAIREQHIATCSFAKEHRHPVGPVEQLDNADIRIAKAKKAAEEDRKREAAEAKKRAKIA
jgi:hypothetical protein